MDLPFFNLRHSAGTRSTVSGRRRKGTTATPSKFQLYEPATMRSWWLKLGPNTIGRNPDNDIVLREDSVSRYHARIMVTDASLFIEDLKSANGVYIAGERIKGSPLTQDIAFSLGNTSLLVRKPSIFEDEDGYPRDSRH